RRFSKVIEDASRALADVSGFLSALFCQKSARRIMASITSRLAIRSYPSIVVLPLPRYGQELGKSHEPIFLVVAVGPMNRRRYYQLQPFCLHLRGLVLRDAGLQG